MYAYEKLDLKLINLGNAEIESQSSQGIVGSTEAPSKVFLLFFLLPDWLKLNHLKSRLDCGFSDIFSRHFCSIVAETIGVTINSASFGAKKCSENHIRSCWKSEKLKCVHIEDRKCQENNECLGKMFCLAAITFASPKVSVTARKKSG